ncbi:histidinol-phosphatase, partial [Enterococcus xinjiangensis]
DYGFRVFGLSVAEFKQYEAQFLPILVAISITTIMNG